MIQWQDFLAACALVLVLEGVFPFISPQSLRRALETVSHMSDGQLRGLGLASMMVGLILLYIVKS